MEKIFDWLILLCTMHYARAYTAIINFNHVTYFGVIFHQRQRWYFIRQLTLSIANY